MSDTPVVEPGTGTPISGELVELPAAAVIPSVAEENSAAERARGRTSVQVGIPAALVGFGSYLFRMAHVDLDPGAGSDLPADVSGYLVALLAYVLVVRMNPKKK